MARTPAFVLGAVCTLWATVVSALGLGDITLHSALNQNFNAEIQLFRVRDLGNNEMIPRLASAQDFERIGIERFFFLTSLKFDIEGSGNDAIVRISSREPVTEPYLNFLVEIIWPSGRLLKEYTVLLDPPVFTKDEGVAPVSPGRAMAAPDRGVGLVVREEVEIPLPVEDVERPAPLPAYTKEERFTGETYGMTDRDDTMWSIALMTRPSGDVSVQQTMLAFVRLNPEAFIGNNVNLVKAGFVLRVPTEDEIRQLSQHEAVAAVMRHNALWESYRIGEGIEPIDASEPSMSRTYAETGRDEGELRLVSSADAGAEAATGASDVTRGASATRDMSMAELTAAEEERDRVARENDELRESRRMLESQNENVRRQLQIKNEQLAQLQQQLAQVREQLEEVQAQPTTPTVTTPVPEPAAAAPSGPFAFVMNNIVLVGGALALVIVLFVALRVYSARREAAEFDDVSFEDALPDEFDVFDSAEQPAVAEPSEQFLDLAEEEEEPEAEEAAELDFSFDEAELEVGDQTLQTSDVVSEADIYIAYGRFPQAISFLQSALESEPERSDVRLKLMEVYVETKDLEGFIEQSTALLSQAEGDEAVMRRARQLQAQIPGADAIPTSRLDEDLDLSDTLVGVDEIADAAREAIDESDDDRASSLDLDLNLDDADLADSDAKPGEPSLDFDLDLESDDEKPDAADSLDLELDLEEDSERSPTLHDLEIAPQADELDLELDIDLDEDAFTPAVTGEHPAADLTPPEESAADEELADLELEPFGDDDEGADAEAPAEKLLGIGNETQEFDLSDLTDQAAVLEDDISEDVDEEIELSVEEDSDAELSLDEVPEPPVPSMPADVPEPASPTEEFDLAELDLDAGGGGDIADEVELLLSDAEDETSTKLSLARAYIDMGDSDGARDILNEVVEEGSEEQQKEANELLSQLT